jgi:hypothetical protein
MQYQHIKHITKQNLRLSNQRHPIQFTDYKATIHEKLSQSSK